MKIVVYTANIGDYDSVDIPQFLELNKDVKFVLFTTNKQLRSNKIDIRYVEDYMSIDRDPQRVARFFKLQPHKVLPPHDISIWHDSCLSLKITNYNKVVEENLINRSLEMICYRHPNRNCLYREASACISQSLDNQLLIKRQIERYKGEGFPSNKGLYDTGIMIRVNSQKMQVFNDMWYDEVKRGSKRDQISHMYCIRKNKVRIGSFIEGYGDRKGKSLILTKRKHIKDTRVKRSKFQEKKDLSLEIMNRKIAYKMKFG